MSNNIWELPNSPPPPLFLGKKERNYVKQLNDEIVERVVGQTTIYYPIDLKTTNFHPIYGEALEKSFLPPVRVYALVKWEGDETTTDLTVLDRVAKITINFHRRRLTEDQDLFVREGDFILYAGRFWEITKLIDPRLLFGQQEHKFEIRAECIRARDGLFQEPTVIGEVQQLIIDSDDDLSQEQVSALLNSYDIAILSGDDPAFVDMYTNPNTYTGRIIYLSTLSSTNVVEPFDQAGKFYFNENGVWVVSSLYQNF
jgi:hypothetical protein